MIGNDTRLIGGKVPERFRRVTETAARTGSRSRRTRGSRPPRSAPRARSSPGSSADCRGSFTASRRGLAATGAAGRRPGRSSRSRARRRPAPGELAGPRAAPRAGRGRSPTGGPSSWRASDCSVGGGSARGLWLLVSTSASQAAAATPASPRRPCRRGSRRPRPRGRAPATSSGSDSASAAIPSGLWAPSSSVSGSSSTTCSRPGTRISAAAAATASLVELAQVRLGGGPRQREVASLERAQRADRDARVAAGLDDRRAALARRPLAPPLSASGCRPAPSTSVAARLDDVELLARDVGDRRSQPAGVLEPDAGQHLHLRGDHVGGVVAAAEAGLDHRHLDLASRQLGVGRGGQHLELRDPVVAAAASGRRARRRARRAAPRRRTPPARGPRRRSGSARRTTPGAATGRRRCAARGAARIAAIIRAVEDLPLVPTTWIDSKAPLADGPARSSAGACGPARTACRTARATAGSARRPRAHHRPGVTAPPARAQPRRACRARPRPRPAAPWPRSPRWRACAQRARSRPRARPPGGALAPRGLEVELVAGEDLDRTARDRRPRPTGAAPSPVVGERQPRQPREVLAGLLVAVGAASRARSVAPGLHRRPSRASAQRLHRVDHRAQRRLGGGVGARPAASRDARGEQPLGARDVAVDLLGHERDDRVRQRERLR